MIKWKLTITQRFFNKIVLFHDQLESITEFVDMMEAEFPTEGIKYEIESVEEEETFSGIEIMNMEGES